MKIEHQLYDRISHLRCVQHIPAKREVPLASQSQA